ncbi:MAG TPA: hemerythrin domain-containing protein [Capsulimonadaceae bacterium]
MTPTEPKTRSTKTPNLADASVNDVITYLVDEQHANLRASLARVQSLLATISASQTPQSPDLLRITEIVDGFDDVLIDHIDREEQIVFPLIKILDQRNALPLYNREHVNSPVNQLQTEHNQSTEVFAALRELTDSYTKIDGASSNYNQLMDDLKSFETSMEDHVETERTYLFARISRELN